MMIAPPPSVTTQHSSTVSGYADFMTRWGETYPASGGAFVKRELEHFMTASGHVDFAVPITVFKSPAGAIIGFAAPVEHPYDSWMEVECMLAGREMVTAARAAVAAWLKDLPS